VLNKIGGLPAHVLLVHAVVVLLPLTAGMLVAGAVWPAARRKLGFLTPALALVDLVLVPITTNAGEWLQQRLPETPAIERHQELGDQLLPWALGIFVVSAAVWLLGRRFDLSWRPAPAGEPAEADPTAIGTGTRTATSTGTATMTRPVATEPTLRRLPVWATAVVAVLAIAVSSGGMIQLYRIGESGAKAVWGSTADLPARSGGGDGD
jgi:hypothetical protein